MNFQQIQTILAKLKAESVVLLCHHNTDPDALCSAYALKDLIKHFYPQLEIQIGAAHGISRLSKHLLTYLPIQITHHPDISNSGVIIMLDTNTIQQLNNLAGEVKSSKAPLIVIDHHAPHPKTEEIATLYMADDDSSSTCEMVYTLYQEAGIKPNKNVAEALFLGIAYDTRHFIIADSSTFKTISELIDEGVNAQETLPILSLPLSSSERIARLKAGRRVEIQKINGWIVATSHVGAYQASSARALIHLGAHVAVVAGQKKKELNISLRSNRDFYKQTAVHLGKDIAKPLGEHLHGMGGGHSTAAGANGTGEIEAGIKYGLCLLKQEINQ